MRTFAEKPKSSQQTKAAKSTNLTRQLSGPNRDVYSIFRLQRTFGNQAVQRLLQSNAEELQATTTTSTRFSHDFSQIPIFSPSLARVQPKLTISAPEDIYEQEADRVADRVMHISQPQLQRACPCGGKCSKCQPEALSHQPQLLEKTRIRANNVGEPTVPPVICDVLRSPGQVLDSASRAYFEPRFGHYFGRVRVHADSKAAESARAINAVAYTAGTHIVFGAGKLPGQNTLTAHELTHVLQQTSHSYQLSNNIQRQVPSESFGEVWGGTAYEIAGQIRCLEGLFDEISRQTWWYLRTACRDGNYLTSLAGVRYIPEDRADAFGHCWIGCQGTKTCGQDRTRTYGEAYEVFREAMRYLTLGFWGHNSYEEDTFNQRHGRELARNNPDGDCSSLCYQASVSGALRFHGHNTAEDSARPRVYNCLDITIDGHEYPQGWGTIPFEHLERF